MYGIDPHRETGQGHRTRMPAHRESHESRNTDESSRRLPPRRRQSLPSPLVVVGRNGESKCDEQADQTETHERSDTESSLEDATPGIGVEQARPTRRSEVHALNGEVNQGGKSENDERPEHRRAHPTSIDERTHDECQGTECDHQREKRDPANDDQHRVDTGGTRASRQNTSDQVADVDTAEVGRADREGECTLNQVAITRHHPPSHDVNTVVEFRKPGEKNRRRRITRRNRTPQNRRTRRVEERYRVDGQRHHLGEFEPDGIGRILENGRR